VTTLRYLSLVKFASPIFSKLGSREKFVTIRYDEYSKIHNNRINVKQRCTGVPEFLVTELLAFSFVHHLLTVFCLIHKEIESA